MAGGTGWDCVGVGIHPVTTPPAVMELAGTNLNTSSFLLSENLFASPRVVPMPVVQLRTRDSMVAVHFRRLASTPENYQQYLHKTCKLSSILEKL